MSGTMKKTSLIQRIRIGAYRQASSGITAKGNDMWIAIYTIDLTLSDGTRMDYFLDEIWLDSENSNLNEKSIVLARLNPTFPQ